MIDKIFIYSFNSNPKMCYTKYPYKIYEKDFGLLVLDDTFLKSDNVFDYKVFKNINSLYCLLDYLTWVSDKFGYKKKEIFQIIAKQPKNIIKQTFKNLFEFNEATFVIDFLDKLLKNKYDNNTINELLNNCFKCYKECNNEYINKSYHCDKTRFNIIKYNKNIHCIQLISPEIIKSLANSISKDILKIMKLICILVETPNNKLYILNHIPSNEKLNLNITMDIPIKFLYLPNINEISQWQKIKLCQYNCFIYSESLNKHVSDKVLHLINYDIFDKHMISYEFIWKLIMYVCMFLYYNYISYIINIIKE